MNIGPAFAPMTKASPTSSMAARRKVRLGASSGGCRKKRWAGAAGPAIGLLRPKPGWRNGWSIRKTFGFVAWNSWDSGGNSPVFQKPLIGGFQSFVQRDFGRPAHGSQLLVRHQLARRTVRFAGVMFQRASKTNRLHHQLR